MVTYNPIEQKETAEAYRSNWIKVCSVAYEKTFFSIYHYLSKFAKSDRYLCANFMLDTYFVSFFI